MQRIIEMFNFQIQIKTPRYAIIIKQMSKATVVWCSQNITWFTLPCTVLSQELKAILHKQHRVH